MSAHVVMTLVLSLLKITCFRKLETFPYYRKSNTFNHGLHLRMFIIYRNSLVALIHMNSDEYSYTMAENVHYPDRFITLPFNPSLAGGLKNSYHENPLHHLGRVSEAWK